MASIRSSAGARRPAGVASISASPEIIVKDSPSSADRAAVAVPLQAYNESRAGSASYRPLAILLRDRASGLAVGGLWGGSDYDWLFVELLFVPDALRGRDLGTALMRAAERVAVERGCVGVWLDTYGFQARGFYRKLGYEAFGTLPDHPQGTERTFFRKLLDLRLPDG